MLENLIQQDVYLLDSLKDDDVEGLKHGMRIFKNHLIQYSHLRKCNIRYTFTIQQYLRYKPYM